MVTGFLPLLQMTFGSPVPSHPQFPLQQSKRAGTKWSLGYLAALQVYASKQSENRSYTVDSFMSLCNRKFLKHA